MILRSFKYVKGGREKKIDLRLSKKSSSDYKANTFKDKSDLSKVYRLQ